MITAAVCCAGLSTAQQQSPAIQLNQLGFYPGAAKVAIVTGHVDNGGFVIKEAGKGKVVFKGVMKEERKSTNSSTLTRIIDFSALKKQGSYVIEVPGVKTPATFSIASAVNRPAAVAVLKGFYYQRSNQPLEEKYAGKWDREAGHPDTAVLIHSSAVGAGRKEGDIISSPGGWYDAGDYNKYIVNSGISMNTLLAAFEDYPGYYKKLKTNIPESSNEIPDLLDEALYNLRWMLTMQDPADGGVYHKCTNAKFDGVVMPGVTKLPRYVVQKSTAATLDFAAVTAQAARIFRAYDKELPGLADSCLKAGTAAWKWAEQHPDIKYEQESNNSKFLPEVLTGAYGDRRLTDEWAWAAAELFVTTKDPVYYKMILQQLKDFTTLPTWSNVGMLGDFTLMRFWNTLQPAQQSELAVIPVRVKQMADNYLRQQSSIVFGTIMGQSVRDFNWGSNANAGNQGILLLYVYRLTKDKKYAAAALTNVDYLLGRNATGYSFVTGIGSRSTMNPHHRPSGADGITAPVPGLLAGGPNPGRQDSCRYTFLEPETCYADIYCSYASNEITINWNAPAVYLFNAMEALEKELGY